MDSIRRHLLHLSKIPADVAEVTSIDREKEAAAEAVGMQPADVEALWDAIVKLYRTGTHPGIAVSIRRRGKLLLSRGIGHARGNGPDDGPHAEKIPMRADTPVCLFSTSKGITALLMHLLAEEGLLNIMDPVAFYAPEFARNGKQNITVHQILAHRGGIPGLPSDTPLETLWDEDKTWDLLCAAEPITTDGSRLAYHAITGGFVLERVVRQVTGDSISAYIDHKIRQPMGMRYFTYGIAPEQLPALASTYATGLRPGPLLRAFLKRALGTGDITTLETLCNDPRFQEAVIPAGNLVASADEVGRFFQMMLDGGKAGRRRICAPVTIARAVQEFGSRRIDRTLLIPMRYSAGLMLGDEPFGVWGSHSKYAYGHLGLINKFAWADPQRELSAAILTTGIPVLSHHVPALVNLMRQISERVPRTREFERFALSIA
ncbi:MAG: beta-lactamase family protein [Halioglobus sp.]|nr:beta-lactamase family protein [Halioglobus sp.]